MTKTIKWLFIPFMLLCTGTMLFSSWAGTQRIHFVSGMWSFDFNVSVQVNENGSISAKITDLQPAQPQAWANISLQPKIIKVTKRYNGIQGDVRIVFKGVSNHYNQELVSGKETWGPPTETASKIWHESVFVAIDHEQIPDQFNIEASPPHEMVTDAPDDQDDDDPLCDPKSRLKEKTLVREHFSNKSFIKFKKGFVLVKLTGCKTWNRVVIGMILKPGDRLKTGVNGRATIVLDGASFVRIKANSEVIIPEAPENTVEKISFLELAKGVLWAHAKKEKNSLKCATPHCVVGVRGTEFEISCHDDTSCVKALKHSVWFSDKLKRKTVIVQEGQTSCIDGNGLPSDPTPIVTDPENSTAQNPDDHPIIAGVWSSNFGQIVFQQQGDKVTGHYSHDNGRIAGKLDGNRLRGSWSEAPTYKPNEDAGYVELTFSKTAQTFTGRWRYGFKGLTWNGTWSGKLVGK